MISQDEQTSRWILLSQFMLRFKFTNNGQSKEEQGQEEYKDKVKDNEPASKTRETPRTEEDVTARAGEAEESSTSQVQDVPVDAGVSGDDDGVTQQLSNPFTAQQDKQIAAFYGRYPMFYNMGHPDYKNKKRDFS